MRLLKLLAALVLSSSLSLTAQANCDGKLIPIQAKVYVVTAHVGISSSTFWLKEKDYARTAFHRGRLIDLLRHNYQTGAITDFHLPDNGDSRARPEWMKLTIEGYNLDSLYQILEFMRYQGVNSTIQVTDVQAWEKAPNP